MTQSIYIYRKKVDIVFSSTGHYCMPINNHNANSPVLAHRLPLCVAIYSQIKSKDEKFRIATKLHRQFAHPRSDEPKSLLKDAQKCDKT